VAQIRYLRQPDTLKILLPDQWNLGRFAPARHYVGYLASNSAFYAERVEDFLNRAFAGWLTAPVDGLRLDASNMCAPISRRHRRGQGRERHGYTARPAQFIHPRVRDANHRTRCSRREQP
jgi:hypothetical protein